MEDSRQKTRAPTGGKADLGPEWIAFGSVGKAHGLKGAFFLKTNDNRSDWPGYKDLRLVTPKEILKCLATKHFVSSGHLALQLDCIGSLEVAEQLRGAELYVHRSEIRLDTGETLVADLVGLSVRDENGREWGKIASVVSFGAQQNLEIEVPGRSETVLFPYVESFVTSEDFVNKVVHIRYVAEFLEEEMAKK